MNILTTYTIFVIFISVVGYKICEFFIKNLIKCFVKKYLDTVNRLKDQQELEATIKYYNTKYRNFIERDYQIKHRIDNYIDTTYSDAEKNYLQEDDNLTKYNTETRLQNVLKQNQSDNVSK